MRILKFKILFVILALYFISCEPKLTDKNKIFHAGPNESGFGGTFFSLYKDNYYEFCDGDFMNHGCYSGKYKLNGDTLTLEDLKLNDNVKNNRFIIYRLSEQDSLYYKNKYPKASNWKESKESDSLRGFQGDIYELDKNNVPRTNVNYWYVIRLDKLK
ncbi:hypothetical protein [Chryseobacterium turcicum]|uniref:Uncharacterized protein n=1 Tax=Chryseobacterium turcicum TaxID=2898076 RepID=A0A9Q3V629_9FLAO|nr:hypothetical protein [Chryseobacterium turcicum]MCD1117814.1 hypothetical protein [Chryseobacterium turcicum]